MFGVHLRNEGHVFIIYTKHATKNQRPLLAMSTTWNVTFISSINALLNLSLSLSLIHSHNASDVSPHSLARVDSGGIDHQVKPTSTRLDVYFRFFFDLFTDEYLYKPSTRFPRCFSRCLSVWKHGKGQETFVFVKISTWSWVSLPLLWVARRDRKFLNKPEMGYN